MLFWKRNGKRTEEGERGVAPNKDVVWKLPPKKEAPRRVEQVEGCPVASRTGDP